MGILFFFRKPIQTAVWIWFLDTQNTFYLMVKGLKNAYLMHFSSLASWFHCRVCYYLQCSSSLSQGVKQRVKKLFFGQNSFQLMYNHKPKSNAPLRKNHKTENRETAKKQFKMQKNGNQPKFHQMMQKAQFKSQF